MVLCAYLMLYGTFRFLIGFFREPDSQVGYIFGMITLGQILSALMLITGITLYIFRKKSKI